MEGRRQERRVSSPEILERVRVAALSISSSLTSFNISGASYQIRYSTIVNVTTMPPRIPLRTLAHSSHPLKSSSTIPTFLLPFLNHAPIPQTSTPNLRQTRCKSILSSLSDTPGAYNKKIRRGRGPSSGKGQKSGRGTHGQKARGKVPAGFTGGQTPDEVVHGKFGMKNVYVSFHFAFPSPLNPAIEVAANSTKDMPSI
jgi:hypothetical protein